MPSLSILLVMDILLLILTLISKYRLAAELLLILKNALPEIKAIRKVRQKRERAKAVFAMSLDCTLTTASPK